MSAEGAKEQKVPSMKAPPPPPWHSTRRCGAGGDGTGGSAGSDLNPWPTPASAHHLRTSPTPMCGAIPLVISKACVTSWPRPADPHISATCSPGGCARTSNCACLPPSLLFFSLLVFFTSLSASCLSPSLSLTFSLSLALSLALARSLGSISFSLTFCGRVTS